MNETIFKNFLDGKESELGEKLMSLFQMPLHPDITNADIEIFIDEYFEETFDSIASIWIYFDGKNKKVDKNDKSLFPGRSMEIIDIQISDDDEQFTEYLEEVFATEDKFVLLGTMANLVKNWFVDCWKKSNGENYSIPVEIGVHDGFGDGKIIKLS